jgi:hypothetical protein
MHKNIGITGYSPFRIVPADPETFIKKFPQGVVAVSLHMAYLIPDLCGIRGFPKVIRDLFRDGIARGLRPFLPLFIVQAQRTG